MDGHEKVNEIPTFENFDKRRSNKTVGVILINDNEQLVSKRPSLSRYVLL